MRVALVHGFTQTASSWDDVLPRLPPSLEPVCIELPGHGRQTAVRTDFAGAARAVGEAGGQALYVGYSMGGRVALQLALEQAELVRGLVLVSASPGLATEEERATRRGADELLATEIEEDGVDSFLVRWLAQPLFTGVPDDAAGRADRKRNTAAGLASALRTLGTGAQPSRWDDLAALSMPVLLIAGGRDAKYTAIADAMAELIGPNAHSAVVPNVGHAVPIEAPESFARLLIDFARDVETRAR